MKSASVPTKRVTVSTNSDLFRDSQDEFLDRYVLPLGRVRIAAFGDKAKGLIVKCNAAGAMWLSWWCINSASEPGGVIELNPKEELLKDTWFGQTEPGSSDMGIFRDKNLPGGFVSFKTFDYILPSPLVESGNPISDWDEESCLALDISGTEGFPAYGIGGNQAGLLSLAKHLIVLAQDEFPYGTKIRYEGGKELKTGSLPIVIEKTTFPADVPWMRPWPLTEGKRSD